MLKQIAEGIPTTGTLDTPIGRLEVSNGYPTEATTKKLFDEMDFQRAVQAYLWALPMIGSAQWQNEQHDKFGAGDLDYVDYLDFKDKLGLLTANATTNLPPFDFSGPSGQRSTAGFSLQVLLLRMLRRPSCF
jgi:hypothetical protein